MGKAKKMKKALKSKPAKSKASPAAKRSGGGGLTSGLKGAAVKKGKQLLFGGGGKGGGGRRNAKSMLKAAYERKAKRLIRMGMLGQARRTLRKKATVV